MINFKKTQLLGHRGARVEALENTLFGFQHAKRLQARGLAGVELDVQLTADGHLIVFHDDTLQRLCGLQARIDQLSLREIQRHTQSGHHIITLDMLAQSLPLSMFAPAFKPQRQALNSLLGVNTISSDKAYEITELSSQAHTLSQFTHIELEIKTHNRTDHTKLVQALLRYLVNSPLSSLPLVLTSFDKTLLAQLQQHPQLSSISRGLLVLEPSLISSAPNTALRLGCTQLGIHYPLLNKQTIANCHRYQLPVSAWTVNDISTIKQLIEWQVDVIITDIPSQLL
ncbi:MULTISPECIES: glycerophosphodiester phosphodiesterase [unclassified Psychrobacter]|uniref:glycerophosphodiester phosphodiesterase n=1 Tax=unclassified Psychrobacter TaxID=196806 RepID=UPI00041B2A9E|nr:MULTISPECIES: glycerophosphodiester phosphodiesterase [unclassified Psychrobacter]